MRDRAVVLLLALGLALGGCAGGASDTEGGAASAGGGATQEDVAAVDGADTDGTDANTDRTNAEGKDAGADVPTSEEGADPKEAPDLALDEVAGSAASDAPDDGDGAVTPGTFSVPMVPAGEPVVVGDWEVTLHALVDPLAPARELITPEEGARFVGLDTEVALVGAEKRTFSASFSLELMQADGTINDVRVATLHEPAAPGGEMAPGDRQRGLVVFELPSSLTDLPARTALVVGRSFALAEPAYMALPGPPR